MEPIIAPAKARSCEVAIMTGIGLKGIFIMDATGMVGAITADSHMDCAITTRITTVGIVKK